MGEKSKKVGVISGKVWCQEVKTTDIIWNKLYN